MAMPVSIVGAAPDIPAKIKEFSLDNYIWLTQDSLYLRAYLSSMWIAGAALSLVLALLEVAINTVVDVVVERAGGKLPYYAE